MRHLYILFLFALLAACEHEPLLSEAGVPVRIVPSLDDAAPGGTRVVDVTWTANDPVGVSIDNSTYKEYKASAGTSATLTPKDAANTLYYPVNGSSVTFRAFCPYKAPASNVVTYNTFTSQSTPAGMQAVDLVYHSGASGNKNSGAVNMTFQHKFSKVVITATRGANVTNDLSTLAMTLTGMPTSTTFNVSTGALGTASGTGTITPEHYSKAAATTIARAIIAPHAGIANRTITFAVGSLSYSYTIPNTLAFETGKTYAFNFTLTQTAPVLSGTTITAWNDGTIAWDGTGNSLTAPTEVIHYKEASTGNTIVIKTNHTATPGLTYNSLGWLTQTAFTKTKSTTPYEWTLTYNVAANTDADRTGNIEIAVGTMKVATTVTQKGTSYPATPVYGNTNCFIVAPGSTGISFTLSQPGRAGVSIPAGTPTVSIIWKDADCINPPEITGSGAGAVVTIKPKAVQGNALIAIHSGTTVYWSYHIWVSDINLSNTWTANGGSANTKRTFMDRNLGATANTLSAAGRGLFYQWGRKDPFPATNITYTIPGGSTGTFPAYTASGTTEATARQNPYMHYYNSSNYDWLTTQKNDLWGASKTINDPCPAGWRVPTSGSGTASPWYGLSNPGYTTGVGGGISWNTYGAFPAAGYRGSSSGARANVGSYGYYWSATVDSTNAYNLYFSSGSGGINPSRNDGRAFGFSVRCVQE